MARVLTAILLGVVGTTLPIPNPPDNYIVGTVVGKIECKHETPDCIILTIKALDGITYNVSIFSDRNDETKSTLTDLIVNKGDEVNLPGRYKFRDGVAGGKVGELYASQIWKAD